MIKKYGKVIVADGDVEINGFTFGDSPSVQFCAREAIWFAISQLQDALSREGAPVLSDVEFDGDIG